MEWMEPGGKAGGAARGQQLPEAPQDRAGGRRSVPVGRDLTFHFEQDLQEERRALKEDQKLRRSKAMKCLMETNRRRRRVTRVPFVEDCKKAKKPKQKESKP